VVQAANTFTGVKVQVALMGSPVQERLTYALKPLTGVTVTLLLTKPPTAVDNEVGVAATVNPAAVETFACTTSGLEIEVRYVVWPV
jgi:hypothetical protein